jgi:hypothetical protein
MAARSHEEHLRHITQKYGEYTKARTALDSAYIAAIDDGVAYTQIGEAVGKSETTIRQLAHRRGWSKAGDRRSLGEHDG